MTKKLRPRDVRAGHRLERRSQRGESLGWFTVVYATYQPAKRLYYIRIEVPFRLRNHVRPFLWVSPTDRLEVKENE